MALLAVVGGWAMFGRGGGSEPASTVNAAATDTGANADVVLGNATTDQSAVAANVTGNEAANAAAPEATQQAPNQTADALKKEQAKTAAAEARLEAIQKAQAKIAAAQKAGASVGPTKTPTKTAASGASAASAAAESSSGGVSAAKLSQFYGIVDSARSMARQVMRSNNSANAALARSYDANLKTLRDSIRGVSSDKEADRLIKQASQTRAYVQFLVKQSQ